MPKTTREPNLGQQLTPAQRTVLSVYLRDYYSQYHYPRTLDSETYWSTESGREVGEVVDYWIRVERGSASVAFGKTRVDQSDDQVTKYSAVATLLPWPRTVLTISNQNIGFSPARTLTLVNLPCSLASFDGQIRLSEPLDTADASLFRCLKQVNSLDVRCSSRSIMTDDAFHHLTNLHSLDLTMCYQSIADKVFRHLTLTNLKSLSINDCTQSTITDEVFRHLSNLKTLNMNGCNQSTITDRAFYHLTNLQFLSIGECNQSTITDEAFRPLTNVKALKVNGCDQSTITDRAFHYLKNLQSLSIRGCVQSTITNEAFRLSTNLQSVDMVRCRQPEITDEVFRHLAHATFLDISGCTQLTITDGAFRHLTNLKALIMEECNQSTITDRAFCHLSRLLFLRMGGCDQTTISGEAFRHLAGLQFLSLGRNDIFQFMSSKITEDAFYHLGKLCILEFREFGQPILTDQALRHLTNLESVLTPS